MTYSLIELFYFILVLTGAISGFLVISSKNPVHSVFSLVLVFANISVLLLASCSDDVEYLALLFIIIYVGAIAILFLFVIMMLNIKLEEIVDNATRYIPIGSILGLVLFLELLRPLWSLGGSSIDAFQYNGGSRSLISIFGEILYTSYSQIFIMSSFILFVAMIGAVVLTASSPSGNREDLF